jgi:hypothetical protein
MAETTYIATEDIYVAAGVAAFRKGNVVPAAVVENLGIKDKVASATTKAAQAAVKAAPPAS